MKTPEKTPDALDRRWHLARTPVEVDVAEIEYALMRAYEAFEEAANGDSGNGVRDKPGTAS